MGPARGLCVEAPKCAGHTTKSSRPCSDATPRRMRSSGRNSDVCFVARSAQKSFWRQAGESRSETTVQGSCDAHEDPAARYRCYPIYGSSQEPDPQHASLTCIHFHVRCSQAPRLELRWRTRSTRRLPGGGNKPAVMNLVMRTTFAKGFELSCRALAISPLPTRCFFSHEFSQTRPDPAPPRFLQPTRVDSSGSVCRHAEKY